MKKILFLTSMTLLLILLQISIVYSQSRDDFPEFENVQKVAQSGYQFLKISSWARAAGLGDAAVTLEYVKFDFVCGIYTERLCLDFPLIEED